MPARASSGDYQWWLDYLDRVSTDDGTLQLRWWQRVWVQVRAAVAQARKDGGW